MLDVSRNRVPTTGQLQLASKWLSDMKVNHAQLYTEHTFAYVGHEEVWQGWSPITPEQIRSLASVYDNRGVELAANQNCFGHLASWLRHPKYAHLAETHGDWVFDVWPRSGPFSLCPTDSKSLELVEDMLGQLLPCFTSPLVNIGCDETYDIGFGRSKEEVAEAADGPRCTWSLSPRSPPSPAASASVPCSGQTSPSHTPSASKTSPRT